ncbi:BREX-2 system phosphatase PglZ [Synoicihabitans lomoniglobus]|uniref:BREX-2 system phosphatase PglZ n=1 Tax=Synoicihabitans lomoniglobus TaxID=2909285 RepID=A0AAF0CHC1_9BACT|nr:BREX-2 system phosphatase PglZ [Opitutaceae bacterium LMO-M01]WED64127.1 BREX-2 system phosphatase PglZ [Opitutaceae bacterium LMO-M01]
MTTVTAGQIRAQVAGLRKKVRNGATAFALRVNGTWTGPDHMEIDGTAHLIRSCASDLQAREALHDATEKQSPIILLCSIASDRLGEDVIARFARNRVLAPDAGEILTELFAASIIDPRVLATKPLVEALLNRVPLSGYRPVGGGTLDLQHAWSVLIEQATGSSFADPSITQVLEWSADPKKMKALEAFDPQLRQAFVDWFARTRGESIRFMVAAIEAGSGAELVPLGLTLGLVFSPELKGTPEYHAAKARLEKTFGGEVIDAESARTWFRAAEAVAKSWLEGINATTPGALLKRVDALLADLKLPAFAYLSDYSAAGIEGRFDRLGEALQRAIKKPQGEHVAEARGSLDHINRHVLASSEVDRLERAEMALRLTGWLMSRVEPKSTTSLPELTEAYHREGGFLDWARNRLREADISTSLQGAYETVLQHVNAVMTEQEIHFATKLADWTRSEQQSERTICIEDVLTKVVVPVAKAQPVLLLVLDGLSVAVFRQLLRDITRQDWAEIANEDLGLPRPVLATLPSVTQISRRALFLGKLSPSKSGTEQGEFKNNEFLFKASGSANRPKLFLKGDLQEEGHGGIASEVRKAIGDKKSRVVGVVVNAIDDQLDGGDQYAPTWSIDRITPLRELLKLAADAERLVVLTSDHGHVLDLGSTKLPSAKGSFGDRYRLNTDALAEGEIHIEGRRVEQALGQKQIVLPWSADIRYGQKKRGYHGGANPQEVVVPLAILSGPTETLATGWREMPFYEPTWWRLAGADESVAPAEVAPKKPKVEVVAAVKGLELFDQPDATESAGEASWVDALFETTIYQAQAKLAVRGGPQKQVVASLLETIERRGGSIMKAPLAEALGMPLFRIDGLVQNVSRILNVDGYEVLSFDRAAETITLNTSLLKAQFELE